MDVFPDKEKEKSEKQSTRLSFANLMSNMTKSLDTSNKKGGTDSFINNDEEGLKVKMTKEQMQ